MNNFVKSAAAASEDVNKKTNSIFDNDTNSTFDNDTNCILKFVKATPEAFTPTKGSSKAAGYDLYSISDAIILARGRAVINTGLKIELPDGCYGRIAPRSGLAMHKGIDVGAGVIDADYTGLIMVVLFNHSNENVHIKIGDRIAQLICQQIVYPQLEEIQHLTTTTTETVRGEKGFGSTG